MSKKEPAGRLARWALKLQEYEIQIAYRSGKNNQNADCLSRLPVNSVSYLFTDNSLNLTNCKDEKYNSTATQVTINLIKEGAPSKEKGKKKFKKILEKARTDDQGRFVLEDGTILVPESKRAEVLQLNHDHALAGHLGVERTFQRMRRQYTWPGMYADIAAYIRSCLQCAKRKATGSAKAPLVSMPIELTAWGMLAMDIVGPLPESASNHKYILVINDYATWFAMTFAMEDLRAVTVAKILVQQVFTKYGAPAKFLSDQGSKFVSLLVEETCKFFQVKRLYTTTYHPQTDGLVERFNRTLLDMLAAYASEKPELWDQTLHLVTMAYNTSVHSSLKQTPFYLLYGRDAILPTENIKDRRVRLVNEEPKLDHEWQEALELSRKFLKKSQEMQKETYDKQTKIPNFKLYQTVLYKNHRRTNKLESKWIGPFTIVKIISEITIQICDKSNNCMIVHANHLKPFENSQKSETV